MKKSIRIVFLAFLIMILFPLSLSGENIFDYADLLNENLEKELSDKAARLEESYTITVGEQTSNVGIYIMTIPDKSYFHVEAYDIEELSEMVYEDYEFGLGEELNGILLLMDMGERKFDIVAHGFAGHYTFTDYGKEKLQESFLDDFEDDSWYYGFDDYLDEIERELIWAEKGEPVDVGSASESLRETLGLPLIIAIAFAIGLVIALSVCSYFKSQMKSVRPAASAENFVSETGLAYTEKLDDFIKTTETVRIIESSSKSGGTSVNGSGYSHSSGSF